MSNAYDAPAPGPHEFGPAGNATIKTAARWIGLWSWISIAAGVATAGAAGARRLADPGASLAGIILGLLYVMVGYYFRGSATAMREVVETKGSDVGHLLEALERLTSAFKAMVVLVGIGVGVTLLLAGLELLAGGRVS